MLRYFLTDLYRLGSPSKLTPGHLREKKESGYETEGSYLTPVHWADTTKS